MVEAVGRDEWHSDIGQVAYNQGLEAAAKIAETWGGATPNPEGRRAALAAKIRELKYPEVTA